MSYFIRCHHLHHHHSLLSLLIVPWKVFQTVDKYSFLNLYVTIIFVLSFIIVQTSEISLSHFEKSSIFVKDLKAEINVNAQYAHMTTSTCYCWIVVYLTITVGLCEFVIYKCGQNAEGCEGISVSHYRLKCIKLYCLYIRRNCMYYLQGHIIRNSSTKKGLYLRYDKRWYRQNLLYKYRSDNNPPKF